MTDNQQLNGQNHQLFNATAGIKTQNPFYNASEIPPPKLQWLAIYSICRRCRLLSKRNTFSRQRCILRFEERTSKYGTGRITAPFQGHSSSLFFQCAVNFSNFSEISQWPQQFLAMIDYRQSISALPGKFSNVFTSLKERSIAVWSEMIVFCGFWLLICRLYQHQMD